MKKPFDETAIEQFFPRRRPDVPVALAFNADINAPDGILADILSHLSQGVGKVRNPVIARNSHYRNLTQFPETRTGRRRGVKPGPVLSCLDRKSTRLNSSHLGIS